MNITLMVSTKRPGVQLLPSAEEVLLERGYLRFAAELGRHLGAPVPLVEDQLRNASRDGFVVIDPISDIASELDACDPELRASLPARLVVLRVSRGDLPEVLTTVQPAGAIESMSFFAWKRRPEEATGASGLYGFASLASKSGATCSGLPAPEPYCLLESDTHQGLPHLLVDYLRAVAASPGMSL
jgi:hypothetical protein